MSERVKKKCMLCGDIGDFPRKQCNRNMMLDWLFEKETVQAGYIKPLEPDTAPRYMKYLPLWA